MLCDKGPFSERYGFSSSRVWMWELDYKESWVPKNWCFWTVVLEKTLESPLDCKEIKPVHPKEFSPEYSMEGLVLKLKNSSTLATWWENLSPWKRPWSWKRLKAGGKWVDRGWGGWMVSLTWWTWVWASSGSWWWTGKPGMLKSMGLQRVGHDWATKLNLRLLVFKRFAFKHQFPSRCLCVECGCSRNIGREDSQRRHEVIILMETELKGSWLQTLESGLMMMGWEHWTV